LSQSLAIALTGLITLERIKILAIIRQATDNMKLIWLHPLGTDGIMYKLYDITAESEQDSLMINVINMRTTHFL
jgi:hypothetical protein